MNKAFGIGCGTLLVICLISGIITECTGAGKPPDVYPGSVYDANAKIRVGDTRLDVIAALEFPQQSLTPEPRRRRDYDELFIYRFADGHLMISLHNRRVTAVEVVPN